MSIISSQIVRNHNRGNGSLSVFEEHTDHTGKIHSHRSHCALDYDVGAALVVWADKILPAARTAEKIDVLQRIIDGEHPDWIVTTYLSNTQKAKVIIRGMMRAKSENVYDAANIVLNFTSAQIDSLGFTAQQRNRINNRVAYILSTRAAIEFEIAQREEL